MAEPNSLPIIQEYCRFLRSKEMFIQTEPGPALPRSGSGNFWCVHTQTIIGPDGKVVSDGDCSAERMCFESM